MGCCEQNRVGGLWMEVSSNNSQYAFLDANEGFAGGLYNTARIGGASLHFTGLASNHPPVIAVSKGPMNGYFGALNAGAKASNIFKSIANVGKLIGSNIYGLAKAIIPFGDKLP